MKVLIVEDDPVIRMLHQRQLDNWGYDVDLAVNGKEAVEYVHKSEKTDAVSYDLCLMDINMPVMNGIEAIQLIRQNITYLPIIAYSANPDNTLPCLEAGADKFLLKPHPSTELKRTLKEFAVKQHILYLEGESLSIRNIGPASSEELTELRMLDKKGVTKFNVVDIPFRILAHNNTLNKLLDDFSNGNFQPINILDNTHLGRNVIQIHASQPWLKRVGLTPEQFQQPVEGDDQMLKRYMCS